METKEFSIGWFEAGATFSCLVEIADKPYSKNVLDNFREFDPKQSPLGQYYEEQIRWGYALLPYCQMQGAMVDAITGNFPGFGFDESKELIRRELERAKGLMDERAFKALSLMLESCREAAVPEE